MLALLTLTYAPTASRAGSPVPVFVNPILGSKGAAIWVHDWFGINDEVQKWIGMWATNTELSCAAPDIYRGRVISDVDSAWRACQALDPDDAVADIAAAAAELRTQGADRVGVFGVGMGGALALLAAAALGRDIQACGALFGLPPLDHVDLSKVRCPTMLVGGSRDERSGFASPADFARAKMALKAAAVSPPLVVRGLEVDAGGDAVTSLGSTPVASQWARREVWHEVWGFARGTLLGDVAQGGGTALQQAG